MSMDLTGITNKNEYYTNHYFSTVFEENTRATKSLINDESDDRNNVFYCKQLLVDVDEDHDISSAWQPAEP